jgi:hypothetical protein
MLRKPIEIPTKNMQCAPSGGFVSGKNYHGVNTLAKATPANA